MSADAATSQDVREATERLREAGSALRELGRARRLEALVGAVDSWRDPASPWRRRLERELPEASGLSAATARAGLELAFDAWRGDDLRRVVTTELEPLEAAGARAAPFPLTGVLLAGVIPMPSVLQCLLPLLAGSPVLAKTAARDPGSAPRAAECAAAAHPALGRALEAVGFPGDHAAAGAELLRAECVVATGSDETIAAVAARLRPGQRLAAYGHRLSLAVLGPEAVRPGPALRAAARSLALDTALWDQLGCLSPVAVYSVGAGSALPVAEALAAALAELEGELPRGQVDTAARARAAAERGEAEMRAADGAPVAVHADREARFTVVAEADPRPRPAPLHRFLRVHPVEDASGLRSALEPLLPHLAAVALAGFGAREAEVAGALLAWGASRVCRPGRLQAPPVSWHHDNQPLLLPLLRLGDLDPSLRG